MGMCGIIFDLDGVLCYTDHYHYLAWKALADRLSLPFDEQVNNRLRGVSRMESLEIILSLGSKTYSQEEKEQMAERMIVCAADVENPTELPDLSELSGAYGARGTGPWGSRCAPRFAGERLENRHRLLQQKRPPHFGTNRTGRIL